MNTWNGNIALTVTLVQQNNNKLLPINNYKHKEAPEELQPWAGSNRRLRNYLHFWSKYTQHRSRVDRRRTITTLLSVHSRALCVYSMHVTKKTADAGKRRCCHVITSAPLVFKFCVWVSISDWHADTALDCTEQLSDFKWSRWRRDGGEQTMARCGLAAGSTRNSGYRFLPRAANPRAILGIRCTGINGLRHCDCVFSFVCKTLLFRYLLVFSEFLDIES